MSAIDIEQLDHVESKKKDIASHVTELILQSLKDLRFGSVEIIVHESKIVQVERKEKFRFQNNNH